MQGHKKGVNKWFSFRDVCFVNSFVSWAYFYVFYVYLLLWDGSFYWFQHFQRVSFHYSIYILEGLGICIQSRYISPWEQFWHNVCIGQFSLLSKYEWVTKCVWLMRSLNSFTSSFIILLILLLYFPRIGLIEWRLLFVSLVKCFLPFMLDIIVYSLLLVRIWYFEFYFKGNLFRADFVAVSACSSSQIAMGLGLILSLY